MFPVLLCTIFFINNINNNNNCGLRLSNETIEVTVGLRLDSEICQPYYCICGALVDTRGSHANVILDVLSTIIL